MLSAATAVAPALPESPFRGIESFRYVDQPIFFARDDETRKLLRYVTVYRGVLFFGASGCGKSSLLNAGFIPAIISEGFTPDRLRVQPKPGEEIVVERISTKDTGEPPYLPSNFIGVDENDSRIVLSVDKLIAQLRDLRDSSPTRRPLLIFDQFEEFTTLFEDVPRGDDLARAQQAQTALLDLIVSLQRDATLPVKLLFSFREDYLAKLTKLIALWPDLSDQSLRLTPPTVQSLPTIICGSFEKYPGSFGKELSPSLSHDLVEALKVRNEGGNLNLSEVQIACLQLWKAKEPEALFKTKSVQGLLEDYLSDSLNRLPAQLHDPAVALLIRMVTPSGTRNVVSEYDLISQVVEDEGISEDVAKETCRALVQETKLVRRERRYDTYFYDIVSEFLVPWISRQKVERTTALAKKTQRKKFLRVSAIASLIIVVLVAGLLGYIYFQRQSAYLQILKDEDVKQAHQSEAAANQEKANALAQKAEADSAKAAAMAGKDLAEKQYNDLNTQFTALQKSSTDLKKTNDALTQRVNDLQVEVSDGKDANRLLTNAYTSLVDIEKRMNDLRSKLDPKQNYQAYQACTDVQTRLSKVRSGLRQTGMEQSAP